MAQEFQMTTSITPTILESHRDLLRADVAMLSTIGRDGYPQTTAVWFLAEDDDPVSRS
jgi:hypothetical protein